MRPRRVLTSEAPGTIHWLEEQGVKFTRVERRLPARPLRRREPQAPAPGRRPHGPRDHDARCGRRSRARASQVFPKSPLAELERGRRRLARPLRRPRSIEAGAVVLAAGGRCFREAEERGELSTNHPGATGEVTQIALELGAEARDLDALQYHPNGGAWPENMQGYSIPETTRAYGAVLLNAERRGVHRRARSARRGLAGDLRRGREGPRRRDSRRTTRRLARHDADPGGRRGDLAPVHAAPLPRGGHRPARGADPHLPGAPLPERRARDRRARRDDRRGALRLRRDRRRDARPQPDDGQLACSSAASSAAGQAPRRPRRKREA